jgi:hypothetical protein
MTMSTKGWWHCRACHGYMASQQASLVMMPMVMKQRRQPLSGMSQALLLLGLLALAGLVMLFLFAFWYGEGMRHAL